MAKIALSHDQFWRAGNMLKEHRADFLNGCFTQEQSAARLSAICGFPVSVSIIPQLQETTGITWVFRAKPRKVSAVKRKSSKVIAESLCKLWASLNDLVGPPPEELISLIKELNQTGAKP